MVDFKSSPEHGGLPYIWVNGHKRILACLPRPKDKKFGLGHVSAVTPRIPRTSWRNTNFRSLLQFMFDQDGTSSCVGHGAVAALMRARAKMGLKFQRLSTCYCYAQINGGSDQGAVVGDALVQLKNGGTCLEGTVPEGMIYTRQIPKLADVEANRFKIEEAYDAPTFDDIGSLLQLDIPVAFGVQIGRAFTPDSQGIIPGLRGSGGGHCMCAIDTVQINGQWYLVVQNSWGTQWGLQGICFMPESYFVESDNWGVVCAKPDLQDETNPPPVLAA